MARISPKVSRERLQQRIDRLHQEVQDLRACALSAQRNGNWPEADKLNAEAAATNRYLTLVCRNRQA